MVIISSFCVRNPFQPRYLKINYWNFIKIFFFSFKSSSSELSVESTSCFHISFFHLGTCLTSNSSVFRQELTAGAWLISADSDINPLSFSFQQGVLENQNPWKSWVYFLKNSFKIQKKIVKCLHIFVLEALYLALSQLVNKLSFSLYVLFLKNTPF